jgi:DNA polymerase-3 subunit alpha
MRDVLRRYKPDTVEDLTALNALYRPGPIQGGMIDDFINRKWGRAKIDYFHDDLKSILGETLGVIVYQEQVMQIANKLAGYSLGEADLLRRAMGKKDPKEMEKQRDRFVKGAVERGYAKDLMVHIFNLMEQFAGYGFNKSHSAAYALLAYHTAYLKTHYPIEFMAALLTSVSGSTDDVVKYINECRDMNIAVEPPNVNISLASFTPDGEAIRFGLSAIKNLGHNAIESIVKARSAEGKFSSFFEFCEKVDLRLLNKRVIESLIKSGAMDDLGRRSQLFAVIDRSIEHAQKMQRDAESGQHGLFGVFDDDQPQKSNDQLPNVPDWDEHQRLSCEKEILGFFITGHPMEKYKDKLADFRALNTDDLKNMKTSSGKEEYSIGGVMCNVKVAKSKKGDMYALGTLEDMHGAVSFLCFSDNYKRLTEKLKLEVPVLVKGSIRIEEENPPKIMVSDIIPLETAVPKLPMKVRVKVPLESATAGTIDALHGIFGECKGNAKVLFDLEQAGDFLVVMEAESYNVQADRAFIARVEEVCGRGAVRAID